MCMQSQSIDLSFVRCDWSSRSSIDPGRTGEDVRFFVNHTYFWCSSQAGRHSARRTSSCRNFLRGLVEADMHAYT